MVCGQKKARCFFPNAFFLLIEANRYHQKELEHYKTVDNKVDYVLSAAGDREGEINFAASDPFGGLASHLELEEFNRFNLQSAEPISEKHFIRVPLTTIDSEVAKRKLTPPFFLKLDVHGFEVPIFDGAKESLKLTSLIQVETYNFNLTKDSLRFHQICMFLESEGFRVIDMCEPLYRVKDKMLWQIDFFFSPSASKEFDSNTYE